MKKLPDTQENRIMNEILEGSCRNPHDFLGMHQVPDGIAVRVYDPEAESVSVIAGNKRHPMTKEKEQGIFTYVFPRRKKLFAYEVEKKYAESTFTSPDPYCFLPTLGEMDIYLFNQGEHQRVYDVMGAHVRNLGGVEGVSFAVCPLQKGCVYVLVTQSCPTLCDPLDCSPPGSFVHWVLQGRYTEVGCHFLQGIFPTPRLNLGLPHYTTTPG